MRKKLSYSFTVSVRMKNSFYAVLSHHTFLCGAQRITSGMQAVNKKIETGILQNVASLFCSGQHANMPKLGIFEFDEEKLYP